LNKESWIINGIGYWEEMEQPLSQSDLVIFLDMLIEIYKERAECRIAQEKLVPNPDITECYRYGDI